MLIDIITIKAITCIYAALNIGLFITSALSVIQAVYANTFLQTPSLSSLFSL